MMNDWKEWGILTSMLVAAVMWVQVPQWADDWAICAVDIPDAKCHWYVMSPDNTFGEGFDCCLLYTSPSPRDRTRSRMPSSA